MDGLVGAQVGPATGRRLRKADRIAIVGAGPAGIHLAHLLNARRYSHVTVFERENRVGGRVLSVEHKGFAHEMGACYIPDHYDEYRRLVRTYRVGTLGAPKSYHRSIYSSEFDGAIREYPVADYSGKLMTALEKAGLLRPVPRLGRILQLVGALRRYFRLRRRLLGSNDVYPFGTVPAPQAAAELARPFLEVARQHRLEVMLPYFRLAQSAQGYGVLETIPTFYVLLWNVPQIVMAFVKNRFGINRRPIYEMLDVGNQKAFARIAEADRLDVRTGVSVTHVARRDGGVRLSFADGPGQDFDQVVFTTDLPEAVQSLDDATEFERTAANSLTSSTFVTTLFEAERWPVAAGMAYVIDPFQPGGAFTLSGLRDIRFRFPEAGGPGCAAVAYQYADRPFGPADPAEFERRFASEMNDIGFRGLRIVCRHVWPYFFRFTSSAVAQGVPWRLFQEQGMRNTWYAGSSACFESINDVMRYNLLLVERYAET